MAFPTCSTARPVRKQQKQRQTANRVNYGGQARHCRAAKRHSRSKADRDNHVRTNDPIFKIMGKQQKYKNLTRRTDRSFARPFMKADDQYTIHSTLCSVSGLNSICGLHSYLL